MCLCTDGGDGLMGHCVEDVSEGCEMSTTYRDKWVRAKEKRRLSYC